MSGVITAAVNTVAREGARGNALHPSLYLDPLVLAREQRAIFSRTWQLAGHVGDLPEPGSYLTAQAGDQPVLVVRDEDGGLRAFRNVCRHRGSRLLSGAGTAKKAIRCRYHGWTYRLDGSLVGVPEARSYEGLDKSCLGLHPARAETFEGLVFVNLDLDAPPLAERLAGLAGRIAPYGVAGLERFGPYTPGDDGDSPRAHSQPANWKVVVDNYLEGYHVPIAHPGLMRLLDYQRYTVECGEDWVWVEAPFRERPSSNRSERLYRRLAHPMPGLGEDARDVWRYAFIYPNTTIDLYPDQVNTWQMVPAGVARTRDVWGTYRHPGSGPLTRLAQRLNLRLNADVLDEDVEIVDNVQRGLASEGYECGPLSRREEAVAWFAERVRSDLERGAA